MCDPTEAIEDIPDDDERVVDIDIDEFDSVVEADDAEMFGCDRMPESISPACIVSMRSFGKTPPGAGIIVVLILLGFLFLPCSAVAVCVLIAAADDQSPPPLF